MKPEKKPYKLRKDSSQYQFQQKFGNPITHYQAFQRATNGLDKTTTYNYKSRLPQFFIYINEDPDTTIQNRKNDILGQDLLNNERYERHVKNYIKTIEEKNQVAQATLGVIQGFFKNNSRRLRLEMDDLKISKQRKNKKYSPTQEDIQKLNNYADSARDHLIITLMYQHGLLPIDLSYLHIKDYPQTPWTHFTNSRRKTGEGYHAVSTPDACKYLKDYLRIRNGKPNEPLFTGRKGPLDGQAIGEIVSDLIKKAELDKIPGFMPKCLRDGYADALIDADVYLQVKEALMGHSSNIYHQYGSEKKVAERCIEAQRKVYPLISLTGNNTELNIADKAAQELFSLLPTIKIFFNIPEIQEILQKHLNQQPTNS